MQLCRESLRRKIALIMTKEIKNNLKLCVKTEPVTIGSDATVHVWFLCQICCLLYAEFPDICHCICSSRDRLGFYAEIKIFLLSVDFENGLVSIS